MSTNRTQGTHYQIQRTLQNNARHIEAFYRLFNDIISAEVPANGIIIPFPPYNTEDTLFNKVKSSVQNIKYANRMNNRTLLLMYYYHLGKLVEENDLRNLSRAERRPYKPFLTKHIFKTSEKMYRIWKNTNFRRILSLKSTSIVDISRLHWDQVIDLADLNILIEPVVQN